MRRLPNPRDSPINMSADRARELYPAAPGYGTVKVRDRFGVQLPVLVGRVGKRDPHSTGAARISVAAACGFASCSSGERSAASGKQQRSRRFAMRKGKYFLAPTKGRPAGYISWKVEFGRPESSAQRGSLDLSGRGDRVSSPAGSVNGSDGVTLLLSPCRPRDRLPGPGPVAGRFAKRQDLLADRVESR